MEFYQTWYLSTSRKISRDNSNLIKIGQEWFELHMKTQYTFLIISRSILRRMRNFSDKICRENQNAHFGLRNYFPENPAFCEIMWKNIV
jgi:hypothetical protein